MYYKIDFRCDDEDDLQRELNDLYCYKDDNRTKVLHRNRINLFCSLMRRLIEDHAIESFDSAFDIGCNSGVYSKIISDFGFRHVLGIDIVDEKVEKANRTFGLKTPEKVLEFKLLNAERLDTSTKYDFILCTEVIEHTENPGELIDKMKSILAPKGVAIVSLPNVLSLGYFWLFLLHRVRGVHLGALLKQHLSYPCYKTLKLLTGGDWKVIGTSGSNLVFNDSVIDYLYGRRLFGTINKINFHLSRLWPAKYLSQFFFVILKREVLSGAGENQSVHSRVEENDVRGTGPRRFGPGGGGRMNIAGGRR